MAEKHLHVELIRSTAEPEALAAVGAKLCYSGKGLEETIGKIYEHDQSKFVEKLLQMGHESVLEHIGFTFAVEGVSRALLAQLTRHRIASFSVQSQRYVSYENGFGYIIPPAIKALGEEKVADFERQMDCIGQWYKQWQMDLGNSGESSNEDARFVLPNACETKLIVSMNARELLHFFRLRMCRRAQWEIRNLATEMWRLCYEEAPDIFRYAGADCIRGRCREGEKSCGKAQEMRKEREEILCSF